jgi:hypothetical protein
MERTIERTEEELEKGIELHNQLVKAWLEAKVHLKDFLFHFEVARSELHRSTDELRNFLIIWPEFARYSSESTDATLSVAPPIATLIGILSVGATPEWQEFIDRIRVVADLELPNIFSGDVEKDLLC